MYVAWVNIVAGVWLIIAPFVLNYSSNQSALVNDIVAGVIVGIISLIVAVGGLQKK